MLDINKLREEFEEELINFRRDLHMYPELSFKEFRTTAKIKEELKKLDIEIIDLGMETGAVGLLRGKEDGPTIALRGDIDALPIQELNHVPYKSRIDGVMHACGHDIHTTCVLGAAKILSKIRDQLKGNAMFVFQPAEEINKGAKLMVEKGLFTKVKADMIFGLHNNPEIPWGKIAIKFDLPAVYNSPEMTELAYKAAEEIVGREGIVDPVPTMGGEDFSIFMEKIPGFFFWLGVGNEEKGMNYVWHNPRFNGDERAIIVAATVMSNMVLHGIEYVNRNKRE